MAKLSAISGIRAVKCFRKLGYEVTRQTGSHIRMRHSSDRTKKPLTIPNHKAIGRGLLRKLLRDTQITVEEFCKLL